jgi:hypothetical protein
VHMGLMREMGSPREDGFNPIAPRTHRILMDIGKSEDIRVLGWAMWRTIDLDPYGRTGPKKLERTHFAQDERGTLDVPHIAKDLGIKPSNAAAALQRTIENGEIRIDEEGRICLNGNAPEPRRGKESGAGKKKKDFCTDKLPEGLRLYFERLDPEARAQMEADYWAIREHRKKLVRDAVTAARDQGQRIEDEWLAAIGYEDGERRGRRKGGREGSIVKLEVSGFPELSVQINGAANSVQNGNGPVYRNESGSVQISASLLDTEVSESFRVSECTSEKETPAPPVEEPLTHPELQETLQEEGFPVAAADALFDQFAALAPEHGIPVGSVCQAIRDKVEEKKRKEYPISSAGALLGFVRRDLPGWIAQHGRQIEREFKRQGTGGEIWREEAPELMETRIERLKEILADKVLGEHHPARLAWAKELAELEARLAANDCEHQAAESEHDAKARQAGGV